MSASPTEGTDMNQIEKVARALCIAEGYSPLELGEHYYALAKAAIAAMPVQAEPQWQGVESAPRNVLVWLFEPHDMGGFMFAGLLRNDGVWVNNLDLAAQTPTHWMRLPTPPAGGSDEQE